MLLKVAAACQVTGRPNRQKSLSYVPWALPALTFAGARAGILA